MSGLSLDHVQLAMPADREAEAREFFGGLLNLRELDKPEQLAGRGGCWFALGDRQLHLGVERKFRAAKKAHIALSTNDLDGLRTRLAAVGHPIVEDTPIEGRRRFFSEDPFGNRIEFLEYAGAA